jgi:enterochelin esterase-like enzyme
MAGSADADGAPTTEPPTRAAAIAAGTSTRQFTTPPDVRPRAHSNPSTVSALAGGPDRRAFSAPADGALARLARGRFLSVCWNGAAGEAGTVRIDVERDDAPWMDPDDLSVQVTLQVVRADGVLRQTADLQEAHATHRRLGHLVGDQCDSRIRTDIAVLGAVDHVEAGHIDRAKLGVVGKTERFDLRKPVRSDRGQPSELLAGQELLLDCCKNHDLTLELQVSSKSSPWLEKSRISIASGRIGLLASCHNRSMAGDVVSETFDYDGGRKVTVYVPADPPEAIVFAGDGQLISQWGADLEAAGGPSTMIVGTHRADDETLRLQEYVCSADFDWCDPDRFAAHEQFFVRDVREWVGSRFGVTLPSERTAVCGVSASGELALAMGLRHPKLFGALFCASPGGGYQPPLPMSSPLPRAYLVAGRRERFFLENATRWADALRAAGADVVMTERDGSHGDAFWREEFALMVAWAFRH